MPFKEPIEADSVGASASRGIESPPLRAQRHRRTQDEIVAAAIELFHQHGYDNVRVEEIAHEALVSVRTFYRYFPSKEELVLHGVPTLQTTVGRVLADDHSIQPLEDLIRRISQSYAEALQRRKIVTLPRFSLCLSVPQLAGVEQHRRRSEEKIYTETLLFQLTPRPSRRRTCEFLAAALVGNQAAALHRWVRSHGRLRLPPLSEAALDLLQPTLQAVQETH